jgi:hypothetical protein
VGVMLAQDCSGIGACRHRSNLHLGMGEQQPKQLSARIASSTRYSNPNNHSHEYAMIHNFMHQSLSTRHASILRRSCIAAENRYDVEP